MIVKVEVEMKNNRRMTLAIAVMVFATSISVAAQTPSDPQKARPRTTTSAEEKDKKPVEAKVEPDKVEPGEASQTATVDADETKANPQAEDEVLDPYSNFFSTYKLGPQDIISVEVFNQPRYSRSGITVPPSGRVSLSLIPGGVFVNGKTVEEVAKVIKKHYDEYIIDPQVTVSLDKASSYRYSVIGDVGAPGIRLMSHRMTVTEAIAEAGGVLSTGAKSKVYVLRRQPTGVLAQIPVNVSAVYKGKAPDNTFLQPGDQVIVPGNKMKKVRELLGLAQVLSFARIFGVPVP
jgi:protein involved in polysaccharide export with SLBB domain